MRARVVLREGVVVAAIALVMWACNGGDPHNDGADVDDTFPTPPDIPWLDDGMPPIAPPDIGWLDDGIPPIASECPTGWRSVSDGGVVTCDPFPADGAQACPDGEADFLGETGGAEGCVPIGRACGTETFPPVDDLPSGTPVRYVRADAPAGGDGSRGSPHATLAAALDGATAGTELVLAAGTYEVDRAWPEGVSVRGRCARDTALVSAETGALDAVLSVSGGAVTARDLRIGPSVRRGVRASGAGTRLELRGVWVTEATHRGVEAVVAAHVEATRLVVDDTRERESGLETRGLEVRSDASATITGALLRGNRRYGVRVVGAGTTLQARDLGIVGSRPSSDDSFGLGLSVELGAAAVVENALVERNRALGVLVDGPDTTLELRDAVVRDTLPQASDDTFGIGLYVQGGASATVESVLVERNRGAGVLTLGEGTTLALRDAVVRETLPQESDDTFGMGLYLQLGASAVVERTLFERNHEIGVFAVGADTTLELRDAIVRDTLPQERNRTFGRGLELQVGASAVVERALFERNRDAAIFVDRAGTTLELRDAVVRDTLPRERDREGGWGVFVRFGASAVVERVTLERNRQSGVLVAGADATLELRDTVVRGTLSEESDGRFGRGLTVQDDVTAIVERALFERNRDSAVVADGEDARLELRDAVLRETLGRESDGRRGGGLTVQFGAVALVERALLERNREVGALATGAETRLELRDAVVRDTLGQESDGELGRGLSVQFGAMAVVERARVERNRSLGFLADGAGTRLELRDAVVRDTLSNESDGEFGRGLGVQFGASAVVERALVEGNQEIGVFAGGAGATLELSHVVVRDTRPPTCAPSCVTGLVDYGAGLASVLDARLTLTGFTLETNDLCGVLLGDNGKVDLDTGAVSDHEIAVCLQVPGYDTARLLRDVRYVDNDRLIEVTDLALPVPAEAVPGPR